MDEKGKGSVIRRDSVGKARKQVLLLVSFVLSKRRWKPQSIGYYTPFCIDDAAFKREQPLVAQLLCWNWK